MRIYVASKFQNKVNVKKLQNLLVLAGHEITLDWTAHDDSHLKGNEKYLYHMECAVECKRAVESADLLIFLADKRRMAGAFVELGMAIGFGKPILLIGALGKEIQECIFFEMPPVEGQYMHVDTIEEAVGAVGVASQDPSVN